MKTITLARKPLIGTVANNVLEHGCGGVNIDGTRIGYGEKGPDRPFSQKVETDRHFWGNASDTLAKYKPSGRFPANLILQHLDGCRCEGVKKVKGIGGGASSGDNAFGQDAGWNAHQNRSTNITRQMDKDGKETVANWICEDGCPVRALDEQSGVLAPWSKSQNDTQEKSWFGGKTGLGGVKSPSTSYDDSGGASRYFKQVKK